VPALTALNADLRRDYIADCAKGVARWNRALAGTGLELHLPHEGFNRRVGVFAGHDVTPDGQLVPRASWDAGVGDWLPTFEDRAHVASVMRPVHEPGRFAGWLAPPSSGINARPVEFAYVRP
jgi:benzoyl-CoA 2,3-dioxygenase component B